MKTKKMAAAATMAAMAVSLFGAQAAAEGGSVYYLNYKPEVDAQW